MFILSIEGMSYMDKGTWSTHRIVGLFETRDLALEHEICKKALSTTDQSEDIVILTNLADLTYERIGG